jgi:DNA-binding Lrp family transcriptional regulator
VTYENLDVRLIEALQDDARRSLRQLAEVLDVSTGTVRNHLRDLEERGVIRGYRPDVDYAKLGYTLVTVTRIKARGDAIPRIVDDLAADGRLTHVYEITGDFDVLVVGRFRSDEEMNREIKRLLGVEGVEGTNTSVVLEVHKEAGELALTEHREEDG